MLKVFKKRIILYCGCVFSIVLGALIYVVFRDDTYIYKAIKSFIDLSWVKHIFIALDNDFVKYYLPDYLWAFSLCCGVFIILKPINQKEVFCFSSIAFMFGALYELLQRIKVIGGTGDFIDIILYFLATLTVCLIYIKE